MLTNKEIDDILYSIDATLANGFASPLTPYGEQVYSALRKKLVQQKRHLTTRAVDVAYAAINYVARLFTPRR